MASDSDGEEDLVSYGTPLEPLEEDEPLKKPIPLHEQTVKDEKGRYKRFHGAFTGGFSAGYFNTVGSKEGWTPSTFVSSRQQKAEKHHARPEDFMDEEDFSEHGIAPSEITRSEEFSSSRTDHAAEMKKAVSAQAAIITGDTLLEELIAPARLSVGVELLRKMGWREGQGVGPRVKRKARRPPPGTSTDAGTRLYGCMLPPAGSEESEDEEEFAPENVTFAPKDVTPVDFSTRPGVQGLGYRGLDPSLALPGRGGPEHIDLFRPHSEARSRLFGDAGRGQRRGGVAGQAFGVGALEDDDDEEVYHRDSVSRYDTELGGEEDGDGLFGWTAPQEYTKRKDRSNDASYLGKILEGFTLAQKKPEQKTVFPPPVLPRNYRPVHHFRPVVDTAALSGVSPALAEALRTSRGHMVTDDQQQAGRHQLDSGQRRTLLGEDVLQGPISVMDLLRPADRQRLLSLRNASNPPSSSVPAPNAHHAQQSAGTVATASGPAGTVALAAGPTQQQEALAAWRGVHPSSQTFKPFEKNPSKQARYDLYLSRLKQGDRDALEQSLDPGMTEWERGREREEFTRASILYRPSSSSLTSRFTRAKQQDDEETVEVNRDQEGDVEDKQSAVTMKMFGHLTRETLEWHPDRLLCRRFNVPDPYPGSGTVGLPKVKRDKFSVFNFLTVTDSAALCASSSAPPQPAEPGKKSRWDVSEQKSDPLNDLLTAARKQTEGRQEQTSGTAAPPAAPPAAVSSGSSSTERKPAEQTRRDKEEEKEKEEEEEEEESRPPMDLFKAIFAASSDEKSSSSEEENDEDEEEEEKETDSKPPNLFNIASSSASSTLTSSSSALTASSSTLTASSSALTASSSALTASSNKLPAAALSTTSTVKEELQEEFGPKLPPPSAAPARGGAVSMKEVPSRRKRSKERKHKDKKQHKHKKEKKKKKHKKHKHKQKSREEQEEEEEEEQEEALSTEELLKRLKSVRSQSS